MLSKADAEFAQGDYEHSFVWYAEACVAAFRHHRSLFVEIVEHIDKKLSMFMRQGKEATSEQCYRSFIAQLRKHRLHKHFPELVDFLQNHNIVLRQGET